MERRKNRNRGYQQLRVWNDAVQFYVETCRVFRKFPYELKRVAAQAIASSDSVRRNIAEGYRRRSIHEYLNFLNIALGSLGDSISGIHASREANQVTEDEFHRLDDLGFKLENGLLKLVQRLEEKREQGDFGLTILWSRKAMQPMATNSPELQWSTTPALQHSPVRLPHQPDTPVLPYSFTPASKPFGVPYAQATS